MKDLLLHKDSSFMPLGKVTEDNRVIAMQAFAFLLMTERGSVELAPDIGTGLVLGGTNVTSLTLQMQKAVDAVFETMREGYKLTSAEVTNIDAQDDGVKVTIEITGDGFTDTLGFTV